VRADGRRFVDRVCLVTGSTGMAAAAALGLAREGGRIFVASRSAEHCAELAERIEAFGGQVAWAACDLSREEDAEAAVRGVVDRFGRVDAVYNVAGISGRRYGDGPLHECTLEGWETVLAANARSVFLVCRAAVRQMLGQLRVDGMRGSILNMSSVLASAPSPVHFGTVAYAASKGAIESLTRASAAAYAVEGIRINAIAPSLVATPMSLRAQESERVQRYLRDKQPLAGGVIDPRDLVGAALFLLSDDARMVTGQVLTVDGGWSISEGAEQHA